ncbi:hypothetical protein Mam01_14480 [Microbispora amethystogenes]|uniref:LysR substrate-binding domain-containing protein n=2 Tax=Microbispora amethystogenes TaxID=1427754 RepID=A0ABQ4F946_9ACTN|nr:hypothetical protein Mam01_14480 [Microbispora amethystogenes]
MMALSTMTTVRAAVLAGTGPAVLSGLAVADDFGSGRLRRVPSSGIDLRRGLRACWLGPSTPPGGPIRDLVTHVTSHPRATVPPPDPHRPPAGSTHVQETGCVPGPRIMQN